MAKRRKKDEDRHSGLTRLLKLFGPGLITGASDDDPSGIGTYAQAGAALGYAPLWTMFLTLPLMAAVQFICAKIGLVSGRGLAGVLREHYPRWLLYPAVVLLLIANTINAGTDIGAIAAAVNLLVPVPVKLLIVPIALLIVVLQIWCSYRLIEETFKWLTLSLFAYIGAAFLAHPDWSQVFKATLIPQLSLTHEFLLTLVALLGTTISPYMFFWQASEEVEEEKSMGRKTVAERRGANKQELRLAAWDTNIGMFFSNFISYFIILAAASTLHAHGKTNIESATEAAQALKPLAGSAATALFAVGLIGAGFLAVPVLTGASAYALAEAFDWEYGLNEKWRTAKGFYAVIICSTLIGMLISFAGLNPISALFWTAVINGLLAPPLLVVIMLLANNRQVMGERVNRRATNVLGWAATIIMCAAAIGLLLSWKQ